MRCFLQGLCWGCSDLPTEASQDLEYHPRNCLGVAVVDHQPESRRGDHQGRKGPERAEKNQAIRDRKRDNVGILMISNLKRPFSLSQFFSWATGKVYEFLGSEMYRSVVVGTTTEQQLHFYINSNTLRCSMGTPMVCSPICLQVKSYKPYNAHLFNILGEEHLASVFRNSSASGSLQLTKANGTLPRHHLHSWEAQRHPGRGWMPSRYVFARFDAVLSPKC